MTDLYRKKQTSMVEVNQLTADNATAVALWSGAQQVEEKDPENGRTFVALNLPTLRGIVRVSEGDYVILDEQRRFTSMSPGEFEHTYEKEV